MNAGWTVKVQRMEIHLKTMWVGLSRRRCVAATPVSESAAPGKESCAAIQY